MSFNEKSQITDEFINEFYEIHFRSKLKLNDCLVGARGVYEPGPICSVADVASIAQRLVLETNAADDIYFFSASLKSRSS